jgi:folate-dependent phosphoribosylglycinamide formyltransferase PurN
MRIVILASSAYSETACAMAAHLAATGHTPNGALVLSAMNRGTLLRKLRQWGGREIARYARARLVPRHRNSQAQTHNPHLQSMLKNGGGIFRSLREVAEFYGFSLAVCNDQNAPGAIARLREWSPDLLIFTGGNILRKPALQVPRLGVLNAHLGLLPEVRGMSSPEWSLLKNVPVGITIHYMDTGIDTGPILLRHEFPDVTRSESLTDLRNRLVAFGVEKIVEVVSAIDRGAISVAPQSDLDRDNQFFVMHDWLRARATESLAKHCMAPVAEVTNR